MSDLKSDTHWSSIINKVADEQSLSKHDLLDLVDKVASFQIDAFQSNIQFCSNLFLFVGFKLAENVQNNHLTIDECTHIDHSLELIIRNLLLSRNAELHGQALPLNQFLNLFSSLLTCESFISISDVQMALSSLKNIPSPQSKADSATHTTINSLINDFFNYDIKLESKSVSPQELFSKMVLKHMHHSNGFDVLLTEFEHGLPYLNVYRKNHLNQFDSENFKSMNNEEALQARANLPNLIKDVTNVHKYVNMLDVCLKLNSDYVRCDDQKLHEFVQSAQIAMLQTCLAEFVLAEHGSSRHDEANLNDLLNLIQLSGEILAKYHGKQMSLQNALVRCFYLEKIIECQNNQLFRYKQLVEQNESESNELHKNLKFLTNIQLNKSLNSYILSKHLFYSKNSIAFEHLFRLFKNAFAKNFILNQTKRKKRDSFHKQSDILNLNKIKNIDDPNTDEENYEEDEDTVATTVTNITNTQTNNLDDDDNCLLIGSWFYEQINSVDEESAKEKENEESLSNSTQILDTTFDLDTETSPELIDDDLIIELIICMQDLQIKNTTNVSLTDYHIQELCSMLRETELSKSLSENVVLNTYNFVKFLLIKNLIDSEKQALMMDLLGLKDFYSGTTHLYPISQRYLALLTQIFIIQSNDTAKSIQPQALNIWLNFLSNICALIKSNSNQEISISFSSFLLLIFHNLSKDNRLKILAEMTRLVQDIDRSVIDKKVQSPLLVSRLVFLIDYILHHFDGPSTLLLRFVESNFLHFQSHIAADYESEHEHFLHFIEPAHSHFSFYSLKSSQKLEPPTELYEQKDYEQFYQSLLNLREFGHDLHYSNSDLVSHVSISYLSHLVDDLAHPLDGLKVADENFSPQHQMYQYLRIISHKSDDQLAAQLQQSFVQFWSQDSADFDFDLLAFNIELLSEHKSSLDLAALEPIWSRLMSQMSHFYCTNFVSHLDKKDVNLEPQVLSLLISLHKHSDSEQAYFINLDHEEQVKFLSVSIKHFNENVGKKLDLMKNFALKNMSWWCAQASAITAMDKLLSLWLEFTEASVDQAVSSIYSNMALLAGFLGHHLKKNSKKQNFNPNSLVHRLLVEYYLVDTSSQLDDKIVLNLLKQVEICLDQTLHLQSFVDFYESDDKLLELVTTLSSPKASRQYLVQLIAMLNKLFRTNMSAPSKQTLQVLSQLNGIASLDQDSLQKWLLKLVCNQEFSVHEKFVIQQFVIYLISDPQINESVCLTILNTIIQLSNNLIADNTSQLFPDLICLMDTLCCAGTGLGYLYLFKACIIWIEFYATSTSLVDSKTNQKSVCYILSYLISILNCVKARASSDTSELAKFYKDSLLVDFEKQILKLFDQVEKSSESVCDEQDELLAAHTNGCDLLETEIYENNPSTIDDTCNDQDLDDNFELNREESQDDDDEDNEDNEDNEFEDGEQFEEPVAEAVPVANLDINELFGAYGVAYQIFDESGDVLRNENRLDDVMDEAEDNDEDDEPDDDDDEYDDDFTDNFVDYENANARSESNRNIYQDLISSISAASINYRPSTQVVKAKKQPLPIPLPLPLLVLVPMTT